MRPSNSRITLPLAGLVHALLACPSFGHPQAAFAAAPKKNVWKDLSADEVQSVADWLFAQEELNISASDSDAVAESSWVNRIDYIELQRPNKSDALAYMDHDGAEPVRYAHVAVFMAAQENATLNDYLVGPLPIGQDTSWRELGRVRWLDPDSNFGLKDWDSHVGASAADVLEELLGGSSQGLANDTFDILTFQVGYQDDTPGRIIRWAQFKKRPTGLFDSRTLLPTGLMYKSDVTGRDPAAWRLKGWYYNGVYYASTDALRQAMRAPGFVKTGVNDEGFWTTLEPLPLAPADRAQQARLYPEQDTDSGDGDAAGFAHAASLLPPPTATHGGNQTRYTLDGDNLYVRWMGFSFYLSFAFDMGLALFDVRYGGERIMYELAPQEMLVQYAGADPYSAGHSSHDSHVGVGRNTMRLVPGFDCPAYATYLDMASRGAEAATVHRQVVCLFEFAGDAPIQRHTSQRQGYAAATANVYLTVRSVAVIDDYDYTFSYTFYLDGSFGVDVQASGWIIAAPGAHNDDYGFLVRKDLSGGMHEHIVNFKADFDVLGANNSVLRVVSVPTTELYPWANGKARRTMKLQRTTLQTEDEGRWDWDAAGAATGLLVVNDARRNAVGQPRGYRLVPGAPAGSTVSRLSAPHATSLFASSRWAEHDVFVTAHHDAEARSTHPLNAHAGWTPRVDFAAFLDGEPLAQADVVVWFNLALAHWPSTADLPNTLTTAAHAGVRFAPANFLAIDQTRRSRNQVRIEFNDSDSSPTVRMFGQEAFLLEQQDLMAQWQNYTGAV